MLRALGTSEIFTGPVLCALLILSQCAIASETSPSLDAKMTAVLKYASEEIEKRMKSEKLHGVSIAIIDEHGNRWVESFGFASEREQRPLTNDTSVPLHELAKLFTAVGVMQLVEQGKVNLDAAFQDYVPNFVPHGGEERMKQLTVRHLMSHHSGLPYRYRPGYTLERYEPGKSPERWDSQYRDVLNKGDEITFTNDPGQVYEYSTLGYTLLGILIEEVSGQSYIDYVTNHILRPLDMGNTFFGVPNGSEVNLSSVFRKSEERSSVVFRDIPANGLVSSAEDMSLFIQALLTGGGAILDNATLREMFSRQNEEVVEDGDWRFGLGFFLTPTTGGRMRDLDTISHAADFDDIQAHFIGLPEAGVGALVMSNTQSNDIIMRDLADDIVVKLLPDYLAVRAIPYTQHAKVSLDRAKAEELVGSYVSGAGEYSIELDGNKLKMKVTNMPIFNVTLLPREDDFYGMRIRLFGFLPMRMFSFVKSFEERFEFKQDEVAGHNHLFIYHRGAIMASMSSLDKQDNESRALNAWLDRLGNYEQEDEDSDYRPTLRYSEEGGHFLWGLKSSITRLIAVSEVYCMLNESQLVHCGRGFNAGRKNVLRVVSDGRLLNSFGNYFAKKS